MPAVIDTASRVVRSAKVLGMPVMVTEQYPQRLGSTVSELQSHVSDCGAPIVPKTKFSMFTSEVEQAMKTSAFENRKQILLCGIETHVCIFQTAVDLLERGYEVHVVVDGVSSQRATDRAVALNRLSQIGAHLCTSEMAVFQIVGDAKGEGFKAISAIAKEQRPDQLPFHGATSAM